MKDCSVFGQPLARGARCTDPYCPQHGLPAREVGRNYEVGSVLIRREVDKGYRLLVVESIQTRPRQAQNGVMLRHEDGHREFHPCRTDLPIERALFGHRVLTDDNLTQGYVEMCEGRVLLD